MDFLDPKKRKAHRLKLFIGYGLMAIALTLASVILLYQSDGYDFDPKSGEIVQNGLVFIDSLPGGSDVFLNGESKGRTDQRLDIRAGDYDLEIRRSGYRTWKRKFSLEGSSIERFVYPKLFPDKLELTDLQLYASNPGLVTQSPDRKWALIQQPGSYQNFDLVDVGQKAAVANSLSLPANLLDTRAGAHTLELVEWSTDNRHVLLRHIFEGGHEFLLLDIESAGASRNLSRSFPAAFTDIRLRDKKFDRYYLYDPTAKTIYTADQRNTTPALYQADVLAFKTHGDDVLIFVTATGAEAGKAAVKIRERDDSYIVRQLPIGTRYLVDVARFDNAWYFAAGTAEEQKLYILKNPVAAVKAANTRRPIPVAVLRTTTVPEYISFSANTRFIAMQSGKEFAVFDAETDRQYRYSAPLELTSGQKVTWMDGHRLTTVAAGKTVVFDYDGTNQQVLNDALNGYQPLFDRDYEAMFTLSVSQAVTGRPALVRAELLGEN